MLDLVVYMYGVERMDMGMLGATYEVTVLGERKRSARSDSRDHVCSRMGAGIMCRRAQAPTRALPWLNKVMRR